jgi:Glycosyl transferases group 1/Methyltransferase domain
MATDSGMQPTSPPWVDHVPGFARRILHVTCGTGETGLRLKRRLGADVYGIEPDAGAARTAWERLDGLVEGDGTGEPLPFPEEYFDCIILSSSPTHVILLPRLAQCQAGHGFLLVPRTTADQDSGLGAALGHAGLAVYGETEQFLIAVRPEYNPVAHARELLEAGRPDASYEVLSLIPEPYFENPDNAAVITSDMLVSLLGIDDATGSEGRLDRFAQAQTLFHRTASKAPRCIDAYQCMAEFWRRIGDPSMGARLLRSIQHVAPSANAQRQVHAYTEIPPTHTQDLVPPEWTPPEHLPRVLFVTRKVPDYGLDVLYDGLCAVLGDARVIEFPWKPSLHGQTPDVFRHYPCTFDRPGDTVTLDDVRARLDRGDFDFVLYGDTERSLDEMAARQLTAAAEGTPIFVVDGGDDPRDNLGDILDHLGISSAAGYFKREMLKCVTYSPGTFPMPFAYADDRVAPDITGARTMPLFWAGNREYAPRPLYLEHVEELLQHPFNASYPQSEYATILRHARIGLNLFGGGFDTVRYWELPAHGCMLFSDRPPIHIPHNFIDGESAVFFDDLPDLEEKLTHYLAHPDATKAIAAAGYEHLTKHHTGSARARHFLGWIYQALESM